MITNKKPGGKAMSMPAGIALGSIIALVTTLLIAVIVTQLVLNEKIAEASIGYWAMAVLPLSAAVGAFISVWLIKRRRMQVCLITGGAYYLSLLVINILFFGGQFNAMALSLLLVFVGACTIGIMGAKGDRRGSKKHKKYYSR